MSSDDREFNRPDTIREEVHSGHDLESGLLARVREWTDVAAWLRLGRTLRVAASPVLVLFTSFVFLIWWSGAVWLLGDQLPTSLESVNIADLSWWRFLFFVAWSLTVWAPASLLLARQGALLTAGRTMVGFRAIVTLSIQRTPAALISAVVPWACTLAIGLLIILIGWMARLTGGIFVLEAVLAIAAAGIAIPCGILAFGSYVAVPLSWAALANEQNPDALDSLSRGYEALFRRPLRIALYLTLSVGILGIIGFLAYGVAAAAAAVATLMLEFSGCSASVPLMTRGILQCFPVVVVLTLMWSLLGGIYLLLRYDTGGQEVEDLWQPGLPSEPPLPEIPRQ